MHYRQCILHNSEFEPAFCSKAALRQVSWTAALQAEGPNRFEARPVPGRCIRPVVCEVTRLWPNCLRFASRQEHIGRTRGACIPMAAHNLCQATEVSHNAAIAAAASGLIIKLLQ